MPPRIAKTPPVLAGAPSEQGGYLARVDSDIKLGQLALEGGLEKGNYLYSTPSELGEAVVTMPILSVYIY